MDKDVVEVIFQSKNDSQLKSVSSLLRVCYCNIAIVSIKAENYQTAIDACNESLLIDNENVRALYLRSKARVLPKSSGALEQKMAIADLEAAINIDPHNPAVM